MDGEEDQPAKRSRRGKRSILSEAARLPTWGRQLLAWIRSLSQHATRAGRAEILRTLEALMRILQSEFEANPLADHESHQGSTDRRTA